MSKLRMTDYAALIELIHEQIRRNMEELSVIDEQFSDRELILNEYNEEMTALLRTLLEEVAELTDKEIKPQLSGEEKKNL